MKRTLLSALIILFAFISSVMAVDNFALGKDAYNKKNYKLANTYLVRYLTENPNDANARYYYAQTLSYLKNYDQARTEYGYVIQLAPGTVLSNYSQSAIAYLDKLQGINQNNNTSAANPTKPTDINKAITTNDNYLVNALAEDGELDTWDPNKMPIPVYINLTNRPKDVYVKSVKEALNVWQTLSKGHVSFYYVKDPSQASVTINILGVPPKNDKGVLGVTTPISSGGYIKSAKIELYSLEESTYKAVTPVDFYNVALHEVGHLVGIAGHSDNKNDIMYPGYDKVNNAGAKQTLSSRDINTFIAMYSLDKNPYSTSINSVNKVLGDKNSRLNDKIQEYQDYTKAFPDNPIGYCNLAMVYKQQGKYDEAISYYNKAISLSPLDVYANQSIANLYYEKKDYKKAEFHYKNVIKAEPKNIDAYCNLTNIYILTNRIQMAKSTMNTLAYRNQYAKDDPVVKALREKLGMGK